MSPSKLTWTRHLLLTLLMTTALATGANPLTSLINPAGSLSKSTPNAEQAKNDDLASLDKQIQEAQKKLTSAQDELTQAENTLKHLGDKNDPTFKVISERVSYLQFMRDKYRQLIDSARDLRRLKVRLEAVLKEESLWKPPEGEPPWPLALGDQALATRLQLDSQIQFLNQRADALAAQVEELKKTRASLEIELRQAQEKGSSMSGEAEQAKRKLERAGLDLNIVDLDKDHVITQRQILQSQRSVVEKNWQYFDHRFNLTQESFDKIRQSIENGIANIRAEEQQSSNKINRMIDQSTQAKSKLDQLEKTPGTAPAVITAARNQWLMLDTQAAAARIEREKFRAMIDLSLLDLEAWNMRHAFYTAPGSQATIAKFAERQTFMLQRLEQGRRYLNQMISEREQAAFEIRDQLQKSTDEAEKRFFQGMIKPIDEQLDNARQVFGQVEKSRQLLEIIGIELESQTKRFSLKQKFDAALQVVTAAGAAVWNFEIFAVDDIVVVDGREIKSKRSVTIGKTIGAIFILVIGFMLITGIIRKTLRYAVNRGSLRLSTSVMVGRWLTFVAGATLITFSFTLVEIPLSAFAFLGGALAIGVGFGTQTLLKNLISGLMLQIEKPIRIGDLVEVDGMTGTVTSIGVRYSTIYGPQGTDTLIPNSLLVENKLTNWTYSTPDVRKDIRISVGYGSDPVLVRDTLLDIADKHSLIQNTPSPIVTLEDFGDNGLVFNLQFWVRIQPGVSSLQVMSDVRFEMLKRLTEAGIELPYPQRVVHFAKDKDNDKA